MVVIVPVDADQHEAEEIREKHRQQRRQRRQVGAVRHLELEHHDRDDDGDHAVGERVEPLGSHPMPRRRACASYMPEQIYSTPPPTPRRSLCPRHGWRIIALMRSLRIRTATADDAVALGSLLGQLGYPTNSDDIPARLDRLQARPGTAVLVAESDGDVVGALTVLMLPTLHTNEPAAWLTAGVVEETARGQGIGA